jgi:hypothetical protein
VRVDWDLVPLNAPLNAHAHPARKWARQPGLHPRVVVGAGAGHGGSGSETTLSGAAAASAAAGGRPGPRWRPYGEYEPRVEFVGAADPAWKWVGGTTHHYRGFYGGGLADSFHNGAANGLATRLVPSAKLRTRSPPPRGGVSCRICFPPFLAHARSRVFWAHWVYGSGLPQRCCPRWRCTALPAR